MRRMNNLVTFFTAVTAFFFGSFITRIFNLVDKCPDHQMTPITPHPDVFLVVLVLSSPQNIEQRNTIRRTWLQLAEQPFQQPYFPEEQIYLPTYGQNGHLEMEQVERQAHRLHQYIDWKKRALGEDSPIVPRRIKVKHMFAVGTWRLGSTLQTALQNEQHQYNDLLLLHRHYDSYFNLTEKLLRALSTVTRHYDFSYLIKVDDDTYVKLDMLLNELVSYDRKLLRKTTQYRQNPLPQLYWGYFNGRAAIKHKGQWKEHSYYLSKNYLPYALGGGYVLSRKLCEYMANSSQLLSLYASEDVSVGTWLAPLRNVYRWHDPRFDTAYIPRNCQSYHLVLHKRNQKTMGDIFNGKVCSGAGHSSLLEYYYDWTRTADKCCDSLVV